MKLLWSKEKLADIVPDYLPYKLITFFLKNVKDNE